VKQGRRTNKQFGGSAGLEKDVKDQSSSGEEIEVKQGIPEIKQLNLVGSSG